MIDREIAVLIAEQVMGWKCEHYTHFIRMWKKDGTSGPVFPDTWNPLESIADAYEVAMRLPVENRAFLHRFMKSLDHIACVDKGRLTGGEQFWLEVHATPRQRCMAMVKALEVNE